MIDFHVMLLPPEQRGLTAFDVPEEGRQIARILTDPADREWVARTGVENTLADMNEHGVDVAVAMGWPWRSADRCAQCNDYVLETAVRHPGRFACLAVVNPLHGDKAVAEAERCFSQPACIGLKLKAEWQGWNLDDLDLLRPLADLARERNKMFMLHVAHTYQAPAGNHPHQLHAFLDAHPDIPVVASHLGGLYGFYYLYEPFRRRFANLYFDIAFQSFPEILRAYLGFLPEGRVVFGSDHPFIRFWELKEKLLACGMSPDSLESVSRWAARKLLDRLGAPV